MSEFYIVSLKWTQKHQRYITFWRPGDKGYAWPLSWAGKYTREQVLCSPGYYNNGCDTMAAPCEVIDGLITNPIKGDIDGDAGPVVANSKENWQTILAAVIVPPAEEPWPEVYGRRRKVKRVEALKQAA